MRAKPTPRPILAAAVELPVPPKRPDPAVPLIAAAFFLGIVLTAATVVAFSSEEGDTVPAGQLAELEARSAAAAARNEGQAQRLAAQAGAYEEMTAVNRRLTAALTAAHATARELAARPTAVDTTSTTRVRVVRVPGPATTRVVSTSTARKASAPVATLPSPPAPAAPAPTCALSALGTCLVRPEG